MESRPLDPDALALLREIVDESMAQERFPMPSALQARRPREPMTESWFFADPDVLPIAGVPGERPPPRLRANLDPERFETDDAAYEGDDGSHCTALASKQRRKNVQKDSCTSQTHSVSHSLIPWRACWLPRPVEPVNTTGCCVLSRPA
jgi:hypothetical protein